MTSNKTPRWSIESLELAGAFFSGRVPTRDIVRI